MRTNYFELQVICTFGWERFSRLWGGLCKKECKLHSSFWWSVWIKKSVIIQSRVTLPNLCNHSSEKKTSTRPKHKLTSHLLQCFLRSYFKYAVKKKDWNHDIFSFLHPLLMTLIIKIVNQLVSFTWDYAKLVIK